MSALSPEIQINYLLEWFKEWSNYQRSDFLPILLEKLHEGTYVNGIINNMSNVNCQDKPMSLFECRIKLFKEWYPTWSVDHKDNFSKQICEIDPIFAEKFNAEMRNGHLENSETESTNE